MRRMTAMKNVFQNTTLFALLFLFRTIGPAQTGWLLQPAGTTKDLHSVAMASFPDRIFTVGDGGTILFTSDQGVSWTPIPANISASLNGIGFANADTGFAVGDGGTILKVTRSSTAALNSGTFRNLHGIAVLQEVQNRVAFAAGDSGIILRTTNRGVSWTVLNSGTTRNLHSIFFVNFPLVYAVGDSGTVLKSTN